MIFSALVPGHGSTGFTWSGSAQSWLEWRRRDEVKHLPRLSFTGKSGRQAIHFPVWRGIAEAMAQRAACYGAAPPSLPIGFRSDGGRSQAIRTSPIAIDLRWYLCYIEQHAASSVN